MYFIICPALEFTSLKILQKFLIHLIHKYIDYDMLHEKGNKKFQASIENESNFISSVNYNEKKIKV